jgi:hypothetical protein
MAKRNDEQPTPQAPEQTADEPAKLAAAPVPAEAAAPELAKVEAPAVTPPALPQPEPVVAVAPVVTSEAAPIAISIAPPKPEAAIVDPVMPRPDDLQAANVLADETSTPTAAPSLLSGWTTSPSWARARRLAPLAATIVIALALGAAAGSFATGGWGSAPASQPVAPTADARALKDQIARLHADIAALKASIDTSAKSASAQYIRLGDRLDRFEKTQAEPTARLAKLADAVDRIERRTPATSVAAAAHDITGSVGPVASLAPAPQLEGPPETRPATPPVLDGWRVRSVYNGAALIQSRLGGVMEVEPGDNLPGLGRVEAIRRQDGKWVVVTNKGLIVAR